MGRAAKGASKGRWSKETPTRGGRGALNNIAFVPSASKGLPREGRLTADDQATAHFSLRQEAQNTERRQLWNPDLKLRHARVAFVSGAHSTMDESADPAQGTQSAMSEVQRQSFDANEVLQSEPMAHLSIQDSPIREIPALALQIEDGSDRLLVAERKKDLTNDTSSVKVDSKTAFTDTRDSMEPLGTKLSPPVARRSQSPEMSDSSNEIVVFSGRNRVAVNSGANHTSSLTVENIQQYFKRSSRRVVDIIDDPVIPDAPSTSLNQRHHHSPRLLSKGLDGLPDTSMEPLSNSHKDSRIKRLSKKKADEEEILADYIANIDDSDDQRQVTSYDLNITRDLGGADHQADELPDETGIENVLQSDTNWDLSDLAGLEDLSTSSEDLANVGKVLSKRKRGLGVQYLVTEKGHAIDDARWIPLSSLNMPGAEKHIRIYESNLSKSEEFFTDSEESENDISNHLIKVDLQKDMDNSLDEDDLLSRRRERLTDEKIARLLSKQEELGLGSSNLLLYDGDEDGKDDHFLSSRKDEYIGALRNRSKTNRFTSHLAITSEFTGMLNADALDDVDIIDQGRPNLRKKSKARRGIPGLELTDTEIENSLQLWENDRAKKKIRKQEREELRAQGLLGKKNKPDLKLKYSEGISMADIKNEIEGFLLSSLQSLPLPSMGHRERKIVHEIAHVLGLKSKSIGSGSSRFPVLYRTSRTKTYDENARKALEAQMSGQLFLPRRDKVLRKGSATMRKARGGGFNNAAVSYRDGEIVGAAAPELGQENKGRAMLEKMGWSTGTALGALNNKGIMQPLAHVVKTTKAGLG